jgi:penicillin-binding protein 1A
MKRIHENLEAKDFTQPSDITQETVCSKSGLLPRSGVCSYDPRGNLNYTEYFAGNSVPEESCDHHVLVSICQASGKLAGAYCPSDQVVTRAYIVGASSGSADAAYSATNSKCDIHDENYKPEEPEESEEPEEPDEEGPEESDEPEEEALNTIHMRSSAGNSDAETALAGLLERYLGQRET